MKNKSIKNPMDYFKNLNETGRKLFIEQMKDLGYLVFTQAK